MQKTYVCRLAGRRVTLHTLYFLRMVPQCVTSTFRPVKIIEGFKVNGKLFQVVFTQTTILRHLNIIMMFVAPLIFLLYHDSFHKASNLIFLSHVMLTFLIKNIDKPLISLVNLTLCESARGRGCSSML